MKKRVFVVEDDQGWCEALTLFFNQSDEFCAEGYTDARKAWEAMSVVPPDLAIIDLIMPSLGGQELAEMMHDNGLSTRVIFLTALLTPDETKARGYRVGNQTVVGKPANLGVLMGLARQALTA